MKILIIDDIKDIARMMAEFLELKCNYKTIIADSGEQGLNIFDNEDINLILTDYNMPGLKGTNVIEYIRKEKNDKKTPIIMISANIDKELKIDALKLGANDFIEKPVDFELLEIKIKKILEE